MAAWKQWTVKAAVALGLALLLGLVQPAIMITGELSFNLLLVPMVIVLTVGSLYISSLCDSGLRAMVISAPVMLILVLGVVARPGPALLQGVGSYAIVLGGAVLVVLALRFAYDNHRLGRDNRRVQLQLLVMAAVLAALKVA